MSKTLSLKNMQAGTNLDDQRAPALLTSMEDIVKAAVAEALKAQMVAFMDQQAASAQPPAPVLVPPEQSVEELRQMLERAEAKRANEESQKIVITPNPPDLRHLPPVGERSSVAVQAPPKVWGDPRWLRSG